MSAYSVLPPTGFTTRAESSEYLAGMGRNELSECQSMLPRLNARWRESRSIGRPSLPRLDTSFIPTCSRRSAGVLQRAEVDAEGHLLLVGDLLIVEDQHRVAIHARVDGRDLVARQRTREIHAGHLAGED